MNALDATDAPAVLHRAVCFCGAVEIEAAGVPLEMGYCHCQSCRLHSGGPFGAYALWRSADVRVVRGADLLGHYNKTGMSDRHFCRRCGGQLMTLHPTMGLTDLRAGAIAGLDFRPSVHLNYSERVMAVHDGLRKLRDFPVDAGGSGEEVTE